MMDDYTAKRAELMGGPVRRSLDMLLGDREAATITRARLEASLRSLAQDVAAGMTDLARTSLLDTAQVAASLGVTPRRVRALARSRSLGWQTARDWVFSPEDLAAMGVRVTGKPAGSIRHTYAIQTSPSRLEPQRTYTSRREGETAAREIARDYGTTLNEIVLRDETGRALLCLHRDHEKDGTRWYRTETGE